MITLDTPMLRKLNVLDFGADPKGVEDSTEAFNTALRSVSESGGGIVYIPPGIYLSRSILLQNNTILYLDHGATIKFSTDYDKYQVVETRREGIHQCQVIPLVFGFNVRNIAVVGEGVFDGVGEAWWPIKKRKLLESEWKRLIESGGVVDEETNTWYPTKKTLEGAKIIRELSKRGEKPSIDHCEKYKDFFRPQLFQIYNAENALIRGPTFKNSPMWTLHILYSKNVTIEDVKSVAPYYSPNTDGLVIDSSHNVYVRGCLIDVGDDCLVIKSGRDEEGRRIDKPSYNIFVFNCTMLRGHGGVVIGSEMSGGVWNVIVENTEFIGTERGIRIKTQRGRGGIVENVIIRNVTMKDIIYEAITIDMHYTKLQPELVSERTPIIRNMSIDNVRCNRAEVGIYLNGLPEMPIEDVTIENIRMFTTQGAIIDNVKGLRMRKVKFVAEREPILIMNNTINVYLEEVDLEKLSRINL